MGVGVFRIRVLLETEFLGFFTFALDLIFFFVCDLNGV